LHVVDPVTADGRPVELADPRADELAAMTAGLPVAEAVRRLVSDPTVVGADTAQNTEFTERVVTLAGDLHRHGSAALLAEVTA
jgi:fructuronate reductase